jgi:uncharacterized protein YndB with AHSA1/START domain
MAKTLRQTVTIGASPKRVYAALLEEKRHAAFTGSPAAISRKVGGPSRATAATSRASTCTSSRPGASCRHGARRTGRRVISPVTFSLSSAAGGRTKLAFTQVGLPASDAAAKSRGWHTYYWKPLRAYLEK